MQWFLNRAAWTYKKGRGKANASLTVWKHLFMILISNPKVVTENVPYTKYNLSSRYLRLNALNLNDVLNALLPYKLKNT